MTLGEEKQRRLRRVLAAAYQRRETAVVSDWWERSTMARIRNLASPGRAPGYLDRLEPLVWRLVPVAGMLTLLLLLAVTRMDIGLAPETAQLLTEDPADFSFLSMWSS